MKRGYFKQQSGMEYMVKRKLFEHEQEWKELLIKMDEGRKKLELKKIIETAQKEKLDYEKTRHQKGRSTMYQVLMFEQEYAMSQLSLIQTEFELLTILAEIKTYEEVSA
jgi:hypothetical protein